MSDIGPFLLNPGLGKLLGGFPGLADFGTVAVHYRLGVCTAECSEALKLSLA